MKEPVKMCDRIDKYREDCEKWKDGNPQKLKAEILSLNKWVVKHQHEAVNDGSKGKLLWVMQFYYKLATERDRDGSGELNRLVCNLIDDFLKLPEGKLVTAKGKQGALRWLEQLTGGVDGTTDDPVAVAEPCVSLGVVRFGVADVVEDGRIILTDLATNEVLDEIVVIPKGRLFSLVQTKFEELGYLELDVANGIVLKLWDIEGEEVLA